MKRRNLFFVLAITSFVIAFSSCKKTDTTSSSDEITTTSQASQDLAISDNISEDANNSFMTAASSYSLLGARPVGVDSVHLCAAVSISGNFPNKTITITFDGTTCSDGIVRSGQISVILSDSVRKSGSTATLIFNNYFVGGYKREGTIVWTNTRVGNVISWSRVDSGKVTAPGGRYWYVSGTKNVTQTAGSGTADIFDDVFSITGSRTYTNAAGVTRTATVITPLEKATTCGNIDEGQLKIQGPNHYVTIDYGNGTCDDIATYSVDGGATHLFLLR